MNYEESRAYIRAAELKKGIVLGLENMRELMRRLGDPQDELKYVHVAGTNGKGSVIAYLYSALSGAGYRGIIYSCGIFFVEFLSGSFFQKRGFAHHSKMSGDKRVQSCP